MNDLGHPAMGCRFSRLGRNMETRRPVEGRPGLLHPNPLLVSERLLARKGKFQPATTLNLLAGAWIQFEVHDWFSHGKADWDAAWKLPLRDAIPDRLLPTGTTVGPMARPRFGKA
jgi:hypothetical protein